jgi:hypothetical protein
LEPDHLVVGVHHRIHVSVKTLDCVHRLEVKFYFDLVVWICSDYKIHVVPI